MRLLVRDETGAPVRLIDAYAPDALAMVTQLPAGWTHEETDAQSLAAARGADRG